MNRQQFYQYLENPHLLDEESLKHLNELVAEYPYFQLGRMLLVKNLSLTGHIRYNTELKRAAAHIPDRRQLYLLVHTQEPPKLDIPAQTPQAITPIEPDVPDISTSGEPNILPASELAPNKPPLGGPTLIGNYFDVSDVLDVSDGFTIDFSQASKRITEQEPDVLPTADLLDYELNDSPAYRLTEEHAEPFDPSCSQPFSAWLKVLRHANVTHEKPQDEQVIDKQMQIIESFLQKGRDRTPQNKQDIQEATVDISETSLQESDALMTETLANIHIKQKQYSKAITIFEKLSLKYPEKSVYFATRIKETERFITNP